MLTLRRLTVEGFRSVYGAVDVALAPGAFLIEGQNGAGKTTLAAEALHWLLFGQNLRGEYVENVVNRDASAARVRAVFHVPEVGGAVMERTRTKSGRQTFTFTARDGTDLLAGAGTTSAAFKEPVERWLGMTAATVRATVFYSPGRGLLSLTDAKRRELLEGAFGLEWLRGARDVVVERLKQVRADLAQAQIDAARAQERAQNNRQGAEELRAQADAARAAAQADAQAEVERLEAELSRLQVDRAAKERAAEERSRAVAASEQALAAARESERKVLAARSTLLTQRADAEREQRTAEAEAAKQGRLVEDLDAGRSTTCPTCLRPYSPEDIARARAAALDAQQQALATAARHARTVERADAGVARLQDILDRPDGVRASLARVGEELEAARREQRAAEAALAAVVAQIENAIQPQLTAARNAMLADGTAAERLVEAATKAEASAEEAEKQAARLAAEILRMEKRAAMLAWWREGFGPRGIRSFVLEGVLPALARLATYYVGRMSDNALAIEISPTRRTRSGKEVEQIDIVVRNVRGIDSVQDCSTGEMRLADVALTLALYDMAVARGGRGLGLLVLDEALDSLDEARAGAVAELLDDLGARGMAVGVVSHSDDVRSHFDRHWLVARGVDGWTTLATDGPAPPPLEEDEPPAAAAPSPETAEEQPAPPAAQPATAPPQRMTLRDARKRVTALFKARGIGRKRKPVYVAMVNPAKKLAGTLNREETMRLIEILEQLGGDGMGDDDGQV